MLWKSCWLLSVLRVSVLLHKQRKEKEQRPSSPGRWLWDLLAHCPVLEPSASEGVLLSAEVKMESGHDGLECLSGR